MSDTSILMTLHQELQDKLPFFKTLTTRKSTFIEVKDKISIAIGMRRTGKTCLMYQKIKQLLAQKIPIEQILYIDFEDDRLQPLDDKKLAALLDGFYQLHPENHSKHCYFFLDEIQVVSNWSLVIRRFLNTKRGCFYLTGSSAKLLSQEIATELRGRSIATEVWPFSFEEYLLAKKITVPKWPLSQKKRDTLNQLCDVYLQQGGFPGLFETQAMVHKQILQEYVDIVIFRDVIERYKISQTAVIKYMIHYMLRNSATQFSVNKFFNDLKSQGFRISRDSIYEYLHYIEDAYLAFTVPLYAESIRKTQSNPRKIYAIDTGLVYAISPNASKNTGRMLETLVYLDLRRAGHKIYYYLTEDRYEIDFLTHDQAGNLHLMQVSEDVSDEKTRAREMRALEQAKNELKHASVQLITRENYIEWTLSLMIGSSQE